jgi:hypothetical protein
MYPVSVAQTRIVPTGFIETSIKGVCLGDGGAPLLLATHSIIVERIHLSQSGKMLPCEGTSCWCSLVLCPSQSLDKAVL